jgi:hypothetical protein
MAVRADPARRAQALHDIIFEASGGSSTPVSARQGSAATMPARLVHYVLAPVGSLPCQGIVVNFRSQKNQAAGAGPAT